MDTKAPTTDADALSGELDAYLSALDRADSWRTERRLKDSAFETTDIVFFEGAHGGELGPFVRKRIDCAAGVGTAYEHLWLAQKAGMRLRAAPRLVECARTGDILTVVMEYVPGKTLRQLVDERGGSVELVRSVFLPLCDAVTELHERLDPPLIHRDLKPSNIIVSDDAPYIIDFGISRAWRDGAEADTAHFGTRAYAPPEQFGFGQTDVRSDVYALGKLLAFCLTGQDPSAAADESALVSATTGVQLAAVVSQATEFDPERRFASVRTLKQALLSALGNETEPVSAAASVQDVDLSVDVGANLSEVHEEIPPFSWNYEKKPVDSPVRSASRAKATPTRIGRRRNIAIIAVLALLLVGSISAVANPNEQDRLLPLWLRVWKYASLMGVLVSLGMLVSDKQALFRWLPALEHMGTKHLRRACIVLIVGAIVLFGVASELAPAIP